MQGQPSPPTAGPSYRLERMLGPWTERWGRLAGRLSLVLVLLMPPLAFFTIGALQETHNRRCVDPCMSDQWDRRLLDLGPYILGAAIVFALLLILVFAGTCFWTAVRSQTRRRRHAQHLLEPRLAEAKQWYVDHRIDETTYQGVRAAVDRFTGGPEPGAHALLAGQALVRTAWSLLLATLGLFGLWFMMPSLLHRPDAEMLLWTAPLALLPAAAVLLGFLNGVPLARRGWKSMRDGLRDLERAGERLLQAARGRGPPSTWEASPRAARSSQRPSGEKP